MNKSLYFILLLSISWVSSTAISAVTCAPGSVEKDGFCVSKARTFSYSGMGLSLGGSQADGYREDSLGEWKRNKNGDRYEYSLSTKLDSGQTINTKVFTTWFKDGSAANFAEVFETLNADGTLEAKSISTSDGSAYLRNCTQNVREKREQEKKGTKTPDSLECNIVTREVCSAYQDLLKNMSASEFKKCEDLYTLVTKRKNEAIQIYDPRARMATDAALKTKISSQNIMNNKINIYSDIIDCGRFSRLIGQPDTYKFETPLVAAERAKLQQQNTIPGTPTRVSGQAASSRMQNGSNGANTGGASSPAQEGGKK